MGLDHGVNLRRPDGRQYTYDYRKANHLHNYFIEHVPHSKDNGAFRVSTKVIQDLKTRLLQVIASLEASPITEVTDSYGNTFISYTNTSIAEELLPTTSGFFFGSTEYTEYYLEDCKEALKMCNEILSEKPVGSITYWSWW